MVYPTALALTVPITLTSPVAPSVQRDTDLPHLKAGTGVLVWSCSTECSLQLFVKESSLSFWEEREEQGGVAEGAALWFKPTSLAPTS